MSNTAVYECQSSNHTLYGFTVKDNRIDVTDYDSFLDRCAKFKCIVQEYYGELDSKGRYHLHGIISIPKGFYRKKLVMPGLHLKLEEIYNLIGWTKYIKKDQPRDNDSIESIQTEEPRIVLKKSLFK